MKKILLVAMLATFAFTNAQTEKGKIFLEANTGFGGAHVSSTAFSFSSYSVGNDTATSYNLGLEGGYFLMDKLALKVGLGFGGEKLGSFSSSIFSYKIGAKYYLMNKAPLQIDINGASVKDAIENPMYLGLQGGYSFRLSDSVAIEPGLRYDISMNSDYSDEGIFQLNVGFVINL